MTDNVKVLISAAIAGQANATVSMSRDDFNRLDAMLEGSRTEQREALDEILDLITMDGIEDLEIDALDDFMIKNKNPPTGHAA